MTHSLGIDLNGLLDRTRQLDAEPMKTADLPAPVVVEETSRRILSGKEARDSHFGRGWRWPEGEQHPRMRKGVLELLAALTRRERISHGGNDIALLVGHHLRSLLPSARSSCVTAIPDLPAYDENARDRFLRGAEEIGIGMHLLWRPVSALLGWAEGLDAAAVRRLHDRSAVVISTLPDGVSVAGLGLECVEINGEPLLVPVRRRDGIRDLVAFDRGDILTQAADAVATLLGGCGNTHQILWSTGWFWHALTGLEPQADLIQVPGPGDGWTVLEGLPSVPDAVAASLLGAIAMTARKHTAVLEHAAVILLEGPLAEAKLRTNNSQVRPFRTIAVERLRASIRIARGTLIAAPSADHMVVATGCAVAARRQAAGHVTYYDFLPMMEINAIDEGEHRFVELIRRTERIHGGKAYENILKNRFRIAPGSTSLVFYLAKEDEPLCRKSTSILPRPPNCELSIALHVSQVPAQGQARIEVRPDDADALGTSAIALDWAKMEEDPRSKPEILEELQYQGLGFPEPAPQRAHPSLWSHERRDGMSIRKALKNYASAPADYAETRRIEARVKTAAEFLSLRRSPAFLSRNEDQDQTLYTPLDSNGDLPEAIVSPETEKIVRTFLERLSSDFQYFHRLFTQGLRRSPAFLRKLAKLGSWCYTRCPEPILGFYRQELQSDAKLGARLEGVARTVQQDDDIRLLFGHGHRRVAEGLRDKSLMTLNIARAVGNCLAFRPGAGQLLKTREADDFAAGAAGLLRAYLTGNRKLGIFKAAVRLVAFLLRHRAVRRGFLHPGSSDAKTRRLGLEIDQLLEEALLRKGLDEKLATSIADIRKLLRYQGTNAIIVIDVDEDDEGDQEASDDED